MKNNYVLKHDFGYGKDEEEINKLELRNFEDLRIYLEDIIKNTFVAKIKGRELSFAEEKVKVIMNKQI